MAPVPNCATRLNTPGRTCKAPKKTKKRPPKKITRAGPTAAETHPRLGRVTANAVRGPPVAGGGRRDCRLVNLISDGLRSGAPWWEFDRWDPGLVWVLASRLLLCGDGGLWRGWTDGLVFVWCLRLGLGCCRVSDIVVGSPFTEYTLESNNRRTSRLERSHTKSSRRPPPDSLSRQTRSEAQTEALFPVDSLRIPTMARAVPNLDTPSRHTHE